ALILSDINLPGMDGFLFLQRVRAQAEWSTIPAFAITAYGTQMDVQRAYRVGYQRHFAKPVDVAALDRGIRQQLVQQSGGSRNRSSEH
ncbi:MAG TPA: response regulator, partial [Armatimonadota bacterium]|nr:response regulator [Armatimonadota bacterium]